MSQVPVLAVALDFAGAEPALEMAKICSSLSPRPWIKIGLQLYTAEGPELVRKIKQSGFKVFLDLKFYDIPNTVREAVRSSAGLGVDMLNIHLCGGEQMARAAVAALAEFSPKPLLLGVTALTSDAGVSPEQVLALAKKGKDWGLDGVVCSAWESRAVKRECGADFICLTPGIRPSGADRQDQARVATPEEAVLQGADFLVVGRPITRASDPRKIAQAISDAITTSGRKSNIQ